MQSPFAVSGMRSLDLGASSGMDMESVDRYCLAVPL